MRTSRDHKKVIDKSMCKNLYYMLCYAVDELQYMTMDDIAFEEVTSTVDLLAELMTKALEIWDSGPSIQEYIQFTEYTDKPIGVIDLAESKISGQYYQGRLKCTYSKLDINNDYNKIIRAAIECLLEHIDEIGDERVEKLIYFRKKLMNVEQISYLDAFRLKPDMTSLTSSARIILAASRVILSNTMPSTTEKDLGSLFDMDEADRYPYIFQKFLTNFYKDALTKTSTGESVKVDGHKLYKYKNNEPVHPDIVIETKTHTVIMDAKWYRNSRMTSGIVAQITNYCDFEIRNNEHKEVCGVAIFAQSDSRCSLKTGKASEYRKPNFSNLPDTPIYTEVVNLRKNFDEIKAELLDIANDYLTQEYNIDQ